MLLYDLFLNDTDKQSHPMKQTKALKTLYKSTQQKCISGAPTLSNAGVIKYKLNNWCHEFFFVNYLFCALFTYIINQFFHSMYH